MGVTQLFEDVILNAPTTEGVKYAGSKLKILPYILGLTRKVNPETILDGFAGTTRVSQAFAKSGYTVFANDTAEWSKVFATCYLLNDKPISHYDKLIAHLNGLPGEDGWFSEHYGAPGDSNPTENGGFKKPWQLHNTRKLDAIREEIDRLDLDEVERCVALTALILALDKVDSTLGHYAAYLNEWSPRSYKEMVLRVPDISQTDGRHRVTRGDIFDTIGDNEVDLAYFDPPYGSNNEKMPPSRVRYAAYYHVWTTVCLNDRPQLFGKANRREDSRDSGAASVFEDFRRNEETARYIVVEAIERLLAETRAKHIILSYSSGGRATAEELNEAIYDNGDLKEVMEIDYAKNVMAGMKWTSEWVRESDVPNREFLFLIEKN
ncbi:MAG: DNA methyltransferase [bacterium]|nr:DNA methyltransferase [bacterium]